MEPLPVGSVDDAIARVLFLFCPDSTFSSHFSLSSIDLELGRPPPSEKSCKLLMISKVKSYVRR